jgi:hypothetical protein
LLPSSELTEWIAFYQIEPFGVVRDNLHAGIIASILYNANRGKRQKSMTVDDFIIKDVYEKREQGARDFLHDLRARAKPKGQT